MSTGVGAKIALDGLSTFSKGMQLAAQQAKTLAAEMKAVTSQFSSSESSIGALSAKNDVLSRSLEQAKSKLSLVETQLQKEEAELQKLAVALDKANAEFGEGSKEAAKASTEYSNQAIKVEKLRTQYNQSQTDVNKFTRELSDNEAKLSQNNRTLDASERSLNDLSRALDDSGDAAQDASKGYDAAESSADDFGDAAKQAGDKGTQSAAAMGAAFAVAAKVIDAAMNAVKNALSDAISRVDTLNQFPKIMQQMGYSAEEAEGSISRLSDGVQGLPTTLDDIVTSAKQFETVTGSLDVATDSAIALNNAFLASGASSADASRGAEQYRQMLAAGTVDAQSWRSVNETMTSSLKRVAESFGYTSTVVGGDFYTALKDGEITMDEVNAKFIELNEGVGGFAEVSQDATGGIATAWSTVKTAVVRGVADMIERIDEGLGAAGLGGIEEVIKNIKVAIDNVFATIGPMITNAIVFMADLYNKIEPYLPLIGSIATGILVASAAFKAFSAVQAALNLIMAANPFVLVAMAIAGLVAAIIYLWNNCEEFRDAVIAIWEAIKTFIGNAIDAIVTFFTETIPNGIQAMLDWFKALPGRIWEAIVGAVEFVGGWVETLRQNLVDGVKNVVNAVVEWFSNLPYEIGYCLGQAIGKIVQFGKDAWNWVTTELPLIIDGIIEWFAGLPEKIWEWLLETLKRIGEWAKDIWEQAISAATGFVENIIQWFQALPGRMWTWLVETVNKVIQWGTDLKNRAKDAATNMFNSIIDTIKSLPERMLSIGKNIVQGIWDGITGAASWLWDKITGFANGIMDGFKNALGIHSPSRLFRDEIGENLALGVGEGFTDAMPGVVRTMRSAVDGIGGELLNDMDSISVVAHPEMASGNGANSMTNNVTVPLVVNYNANNDSAEDRRAFADWLEEELARRLQNRMRGVTFA